LHEAKKRSIRQQINARLCVFKIWRNLYAWHIIFLEISKIQIIWIFNTFLPASSTPAATDPPRVSAIRELIETEQRYVDDLLIVANQFITPLNNTRVLNDHEIEQLFINWYNLIALNSNLLKALHEKVHYKGRLFLPENDAIMRTPRSVSMSNIALAAQVSVTRNSSTCYLCF
jgi:hypothetical protein